jgi:hypothetical protein
VFAFGKRQAGEAGGREDFGAEFGGAGELAELKTEGAEERGEFSGRERPRERFAAETQPSADGGAAAAKGGATVGTGCHKREGEGRVGVAGEVGEDFAHARFRKIHEQALGDKTGAAGRLETVGGAERGGGQDVAEIGGEKSEIGRAAEGGGFGALGGGMIKFEEADGGVRTMQTIGEGIEAGAEDDELFAAGGEGGGGVCFEPAFAREVVGDDAGENGAFAGEKERAKRGVTQCKTEPAPATDGGKEGFERFDAADGDERAERGFARGEEGAAGDQARGGTGSVGAHGHEVSTARARGAMTVMTVGFRPLMVR